MLSEFDYQKMTEIAFRYAFKITGNQHDAEDIAQDSILQLFPRADQVGKIERYLLKIVKHNCYSYFRKTKQQLPLENQSENVNDDFESIYSLDIDYVKELLSVKDYEVFCDYLKADRDIKKYTVMTNKSYSSANNRLSKMRRNLQASYYISRDWKVSEKILTYQQYENIKNFLKTIKEKMASTDKSLCKRYFEELEGEFPTFDLNENVVFTLKRKEENDYNLFVFSKNSEGQPLFWGVTFYFRRNADLKVKKILKIKETKYVEGIKKADIDKIVKPDKGCYSNVHFKEIIKIVD